MIFVIWRLPPKACAAQAPKSTAKPIRWMNTTI